MKTTEELMVMEAITSVTNEYTMTHDTAKELMQELKGHYGCTHTIEGFRMFCRSYIENKGFLPIF